MDPVVAFALVAGLALGALGGALAARRRGGASLGSTTLVPHRTRQVLAALQPGAIVVGRDRRAAASNGVATALGLARPDGALDGAVADLAERAWATGEPADGEVEVRRGGAGSTTVDVRVAPIDEHLALAIADDRTEQRAAEISRREFAVNVSHELKTPVGALVLLSETIEDEADDPALVREFAAKIRKESTRLSKLIQEIIEISRLQSSESTIDLRPVDLGEASAEAVDAARLVAESRGISLALAAKKGVKVAGDRDLLVMAIRNLIDNAIAYSDDGDRVSVTVESTEGATRLSVIDQGIGIGPAEIDRIFERFYRTDPARSRSTGGTGLGLSIVKHIVAQHGGEVSVWSREGVGSTFTLAFPAPKKGDGR